MKLLVSWMSPLPMRRASHRGPTYVVDLDELPDLAGVYVFGREYGRGFEALYVGKARNVRRRLKGQLNNLRLMQHIHDAKAGRRVVIPGEVIKKPGQQLDPSLALIERALIRYFLANGDDLVNISGARLRQHAIESTGRPKYFVPQVMYVDRSRR